MTKEKALKIISLMIKIVPIGVYMGFNLESFYSTTPKGITISSIFVAGACLMVFKDKVKNWLVSPSLFKYLSIAWVLSLIFVVLGDKIFTISSILLGSYIASLPIDVWEQSLGKTKEEQEKLNDLKKVLLGK